MLSRQTLEATGSTSERLREIFTCKDTSDPCHKIRTTFEDRFRCRIQDGMSICLANASIWQAVDIAWDSTPIQKETIPLMLYAQGKIRLETLLEDKQAAETLKPYCSKDATGKMKIDLPRLHEVSVNLIRSYITRRLAAQTSRFSNLWPYFKYEPFGTDAVAKLRGEVLSQRIDVMVNAYNYRHFFPQTYRHTFMYGRALIFPRCGWDVKTGWRCKKTNVEVAGAKPELESYVEREGIDFMVAHPSRYYWDRSAPLPNVNTDTGPQFIGYWDIIPYTAIKNGDFYNTDTVVTSDAQSGLINVNGTYFQYYYDPKVLKFPECTNAAANNDRSLAIGVYTSSDDDKGIVITQHFERINPKREGISELNCEVWVRFSIAGDGTVVAAEFMPSIPAVYCGHNENDDRLVNASMATDLMGFQDQLTNIFSQMLMNIRAGMMQIWAIDKDALDEPMQTYIKETLAGGKYYAEPQAWFYSGSKNNEVGFQTPGTNPRALLTIIQANMQTTVNEAMSAITAVLNMADRVLVLSPNEAGQPNPREVSAREVTEISTTTNAVASFVSDGIDEQRTAVKKMLYESLVSMSTQNFRVPALSRYLKSTVEAAGFKVDATEPGGDENAIVQIKSTLVGRASDLQYDYYFDTRDGADRAVNSQTAGVLSQLMGQILQSPELSQTLGKERIFGMLNEVFRLSGAGYDLNMEVEDGESPNVATQSNPTPGSPPGAPPPPPPPGAHPVPPPAAPPAPPGPPGIPAPAPVNNDTVQSRLAQIEDLLARSGIAQGAAPAQTGVPAALMAS